MSTTSTEPIAVVVLAAGKGTRMKSELPKVLIRTREAALLDHVLFSCVPLNPSKVALVTGYKRELVEAHVSNPPAGAAWSKLAISFAEQKQLLGTGDAVKSAAPLLEGFNGVVVILYGDVPLPTSALTTLLQAHRDCNATVTLLSFHQDPPHGYGRVVRSSQSQEVLRIVEAKDASPEELAIPECNSGIYAVDSAFLLPALEKITNNNAQKEYYLTDIVSIAVSEGQRVAAVNVPASDVLGANSASDLAQVNLAMLERKRRELLASGVFLEDPSSAYIDSTVSIAPGVVVGPNTTLKGQTSIGAGVVLEGNAYLSDCVVDEGVLIRFFVRADKSHLKAGAVVGPFSHIRPDSLVGEGCHVGNFVELKKAALAAGVKANHLSYLGDCTIGTKTNIGAGTIFCNYDGYKKSHTTVGEDVFIGSNSSLVAPVTIGAGSLIGAGSVITKDVSPDALAITRAEQKEVPGWEKARRERLAKK